MINFILKKLLAKQKEQAYREYRRRVRPSLSLFQNSTSHDFVIIEWSAWTRSSALPRTQGDLIHVSLNEMKSQGVALVKQGLENFGFDGPKSPSAIDSMEKKESQKFYRDHLEVRVHLTEDNTMQLWPVRRQRHDRSIGIGEPEDMVEVSIDCTSEAFFGEIEKSFAKAR